jgi:acetyl/propionyl-CoA carboxylase alpha subunit
VEHPVTEAITGLDLVKWQIRIAQGDVLELDQGLMDGDRSLIRGHSIEARIVAEDPGRGFLPSSGEILAWAEPKLPGIRVDTGYGPGREVPQIYDSLLAKVIASGATRLEAIGRLREGLLDFHVLGVRTNIAYLLEILAHPKFQAGEFDTGFLERSFKDWQPGFPDAAVAGIAEAALVASAATSA